MMIKDCKEVFNMKTLVKIIKIIIKRVICNHSYKQICKFSGCHIESGRDILFDYEFDCVKCGKRIFIKMDEDYQLRNN